MKKLMIIVAVVLVLAIGAAGTRLYYVTKVAPHAAFTSAQTPAPVHVAENSSEPIDSEKDHEEVMAQVTVPPTPEPTEEPIAVDTEFLKNNVNILLLGWDHSEERDDVNSALYRDENNNFRSDVMMLLSVNFEEKRADLISIPRDTYAKIYNTDGKWKINSAFSHGGSAAKQGFEYASKTISALFGGIPINYYMGVDMIGLKAAVDAMGGVDYDVDVEIKLNGRILQTGMQHLNGQQVLDYCRARKGISTDVGRVDRQQRMLFTIFEQLKSKNQILRLPRVYLSVKDKVYTNLNIEQMAALSLFGSEIGLENLHRYTLDGEYTIAYGIAFYVLHQDKLAKLARDVLGVKFKPKVEYDYEYVKVDNSTIKEIQKAQLLLKTTISEEQKQQIITVIKEYIAETDEEKENKSISAISMLYEQLLDALYGPQWTSPEPSLMPMATVLPTAPLASSSITPTPSVPVLTLTPLPSVSPTASPTPTPTA